MSKGSPIIKCRIKPLLLARIKRELQRRYDNPCCEPWTVTDFIMNAVLDKLAHIDRSRKKRPAKSKSQESVGDATMSVSSNPQPE